jgi:hypothetical protein
MLRPMRRDVGVRACAQGLTFRDGTYQLFSSSYDRTVKHWSLDDLMYMDTLCVPPLPFASARCVTWLGA